MKKSKEQVERMLAEFGDAIVAPTDLRDNVAALITRDLRRQTRRDDLKLVGFSLACLFAVCVGCWAMFAIKTEQACEEFGWRTGPRPMVVSSWLDAGADVRDSGVTSPDQSSSSFKM